MGPNQLRDAFLVFAGLKRFRKFTLQLRRDSPQESRFEHLPGLDELRYWQDILWRSFREVHPDAPTSIEAIRDALLWCDVHESPLVLHEAVRPAGGHSGLPGFTEAQETSFPFGYGYWRLSCTQCVSACREWIERALRPKS